MYAILIALSCLTASGVYFLVDERYEADTPTVAAASLSQSMDTYRRAVVAFVAAHPSFQGNVSAAQLSSVSAGLSLDPRWQNYVEPNTTAAGSLVVVYTNAGDAGVAIAGIEALAQGSALAGVAHSGAVVSPGNPIVPLPSAIADAVRDGTPVLMTQVWS
jgi:hypothetical protein